MKHKKTQNYETYLMFLFKFFNLTLDFNVKINYLIHIFLKHDGIFIFLTFLINFKHSKIVVIAFSGTSAEVPLMYNHGVIL